MKRAFYWIGAAIIILYVATLIGFFITYQTNQELDEEVQTRLGQITIIARDRCAQVNDVAIAAKEAIAIATVHSEDSPLSADLELLREYGENIKIRDCSSLPGVDEKPGIDVPHQSKP